MRTLWISILVLALVGALVFFCVRLVSGKGKFVPSPVPEAYRAYYSIYDLASQTAFEAVLLRVEEAVFPNLGLNYEYRLRLDSVGGSLTVPMRRIDADASYEFLRIDPEGTVIDTVTVPWNAYFEPAYLFNETEKRDSLARLWLHGPFLLGYLDGAPLWGEEKGVLEFKHFHRETQVLDYKPFDIGLSTTGQFSGDYWTGTGFVDVTWNGHRFHLKFPMIEYEPVRGGTRREGNEIQMYMHPDLHFLLLRHGKRFYILRAKRDSKTDTSNNESK